METKQKNSIDACNFKFSCGLETLRPREDDEEMSYYQRMFYPPYTAQASFSFKRIFVGWRSDGFYKEHYDKKQNEVYLNLNDSCIILYLGKRGSGKTTSVRSVTDRFALGGGHVTLCTDIKNEYQSSLQPSQDSRDMFERYTRYGEHPTPQKLKAYQPLFLVDDVEGEDKNCEIIQFQFNDLDLNDWLTLFKLDDASPQDRRKVEIITSIFDKIREGKVTSIDDFRECLQSEEDVKTSSQILRDSLCLVLDNAERSGVIAKADNTEYLRVIEEDMGNGFTVVLNLKGYENKLKSYSQIYVSILMKRIVNALREKVITGKTLLVLDEASKFYPKKEMISSRKTTDWTIDVTRSWGVSLLLAAQELDDLPEKAFAQAKYAFLPFNINFDTFKNILKKLGMYGRYDDSTLERYRHVLRQAKMHNDGCRDWILVDLDKRTVVSIIPARPLSLHQTE